MIFPNEGDWDRWGITAPLHKLFVLFWAETLDEHTLDTWQVRTCNVSSLLGEALSAVEHTKTFEPYRHNIPFIVDELRLCAKIDPVVNERFAFVRAYLEHLNVDKLEEVGTTCRVLLAKLESYGAVVAEELRLALDGDESEKDRVRRLTMALVTDLTIRGYSLAYLRSHLSLLQDPSKPFLVRYDDLIALSSAPTQEYRCTFRLQIPQRFIDHLTGLGEFHFDTTPPQNGSGCAAEKTFFSQSIPNTVLATVHVKALDAVSARRSGEQKLATLIASAKLLWPRRTFVIQGNPALVWSTSGGSALLVERDKSRAGRMGDSKRFAENLEKFVRARQALSTTDRDRLAAAVHYHNLAMTSPTDEARLVNLWIALEGIATEGGSSIIEAVVSAVAPTLALRNVEKQVVGLAGYLAAAAKSAQTTESDAYGIAFPKSKPGFIEKLDLLEALRDEKDGQRIKALYSLIGHNPLLTLRLHHFRKNVLGAPDKVADNLEAHQRNVDWQLRRIYRARNLVAHRAKAPAGLRHLLQHLQTYFISVVQNVVDDVAAHPEWGIRTALTHRGLLLQHLTRQLRASEGSKVTTVALLDPNLLLGRADGSQLVWLSPPKSKSKTPPQQATDEKGPQS